MSGSLKPRVLICGGRDFEDMARLSSVLHSLCNDKNWVVANYRSNSYRPDIIVISGMAKGADTLATEWAKLNQLPILEFPANWDLHGKAAGPLRNQLMLHEGRPDIVVAFPTEKSKGTWDMIKRAQKAGVPVIIEA